MTYMHFRDSVMVCRNNKRSKAEVKLVSSPQSFKKNYVLGALQARTLPKAQIQL